MLPSKTFRVDVELYHTNCSLTTHYQNVHYSWDPECTKIQVNLFMHKFLTLFDFDPDHYQFTFLNPHLKSYTAYNRDHDFHTLQVDKLPISADNRPLINLTIVPISNQDKSSLNSTLLHFEKKKLQERTVEEVLELVKKMDDIELQDAEKWQGTKTRTKNLKKLARETQVHETLLFNYFKYVTLAKSLDFNFNAHLYEKFRVVREFVAKEQEENPPNKKKRKKHKQHKVTIKFLEKKALVENIKDKTFLPCPKVKKERTVGEAVETVALVNQLIKGKVDPETGVVLKVKSIHEAAKFFEY